MARHCPGPFLGIPNFMAGVAVFRLPRPGPGPGPELLGHFGVMANVNLPPQNYSIESYLRLLFHFIASWQTFQMPAETLAPSPGLRKQRKYFKVKSYVTSRTHTRTQRSVFVCWYV